MNNNITFHSLIVSLLRGTNSTLPELADKLNIEELELANKVSKNKTIDIQLLINILQNLNISYIDNANGEPITIMSEQDLLSDAINKVKLEL